MEFCISRFLWNASCGKSFNSSPGSDAWCDDLNGLPATIDSNSKSHIQAKRKREFEQAFVLQLSSFPLSSTFQELLKYRFAWKRRISFFHLSKWVTKMEHRIPVNYIFSSLISDIISSFFFWLCMCVLLLTEIPVMIVFKRKFRLCLLSKGPQYQLFQFLLFS